MSEISAARHPEATQRIRDLAVHPKANYIFWPPVDALLKEHGWDKADVMGCLGACEVTAYQLFASQQQYRVKGPLTDEYECEIGISVFELEMTIEVIELHVRE